MAFRFVVPKRPLAKCHLFAPPVSVVRDPVIGNTVIDRN
ncbi:hypothetical protein NOR51B_1532 [Luminiphilus syltensis NOR5-1B]|uniref:Uncharacterized protein n=1 Tax=Luminiphilus syltensis NOR5-1B TaxID=565045 RepID=B8KSF6_9GAMM|nr:hypothetical protein NOR51B_1532 [Luminiphilus syltensis NOR5-1B]